jgi:hypothetical protein
MKAFPIKRHFLNIWFFELWYFLQILQKNSCLVCYMFVQFDGALVVRARMLYERRPAIHKHTFCLHHREKQHTNIYTHPFLLHEIKQCTRVWHDVLQVHERATAAKLKEGPIKMHLTLVRAQILVVLSSIQHPLCSDCSSFLLSLTFFCILLRSNFVLLRTKQRTLFLCLCLRLG